MEKAVLNVKELKVTQGMNGSYSHNGELAIDIGYACENFKAPFTGIIKRIYTNTNTVWLESIDKVKYADGTEDYMTVMTTHDNSVTSLYVGKIIKQGEVYYQPGVKGKATGSHIHLGVGKGKFTGNGWTKGQYQPKIDGYAYPINNQYDITKALFIHTDVKQTSPMYDWKETNSYIYEKTPANPTNLKYAKDDKIILNGYLYKDSFGNGKGAKKNNYKGTITIVNSSGTKPYHIDSLGWVAESDITKQDNTKYLNLQPSVSSWNVYKTNKYYKNSNTSDILIKLNPKKYNGLSYKIYEDMGNYHFKIKTDMKGYGYISGNPNKYSCTITEKPIYKNGNY